MRLFLPSLLIICFGPTAAAAGDERIWAIQKLDGDTRLVYSVPESDDATFDFICSKGSGSITIGGSESNANVPEGKKFKWAIRIDKTAFDLEGKTQVNEEAGTPSIEGRLPLNSRFWTMLANARSFDTIVAGVSTTYNLKGANVAEFLKACRDK